MIELYPTNDLYEDSMINSGSAAAIAFDRASFQKEQIMLPFVNRKSVKENTSVSTPEEKSSKAVKNQATSTQRVKKQHVQHTHGSAYRTGKQSRRVASQQSNRRVAAKRSTFRELKWFLLSTLLCFLFFGILLSARMICHGEIIIKKGSTPVETSVSSVNDIASPVNTSKVDSYKVIHIQSGDSLWSIAQKNMTSDYHSVEEMVESICLYNHLEDSRIYAGQTLKIPYTYSVQEDI